VAVALEALDPQQQEVLVLIFAGRRIKYGVAGVGHVIAAQNGIILIAPERV
jgi:hypothetical protein